MENRLLYKPAKLAKKPFKNQEGFRGPQERGLAFANVILDTQDSVKICGWFIMMDPKNRPEDDPFKNAPKHNKKDDPFEDNQRPLLVFMHGSQGNIGERLDFYEYLIKKLGVNILTMAYRGYSYSDKKLLRHPDE